MPAPAPDALWSDYHLDPEPCGTCCHSSMRKSLLVELPPCTAPSKSELRALCNPGSGGLCLNSHVSSETHFRRSWWAGVQDTCSRGGAWAATSLSLRDPHQLCSAWPAQQWSLHTAIRTAASLGPASLSSPGFYTTSAATTTWRRSCTTRTHGAPSCSCSWTSSAACWW